MNLMHDLHTKMLYDFGERGRTHPKGSSDAEHDALAEFSFRGPLMQACLQTAELLRQFLHRGQHPPSLQESSGNLLDFIESC
jgi:hypothetical protein